MLSHNLQAAQDPDVSIPPLKVPLVYGMACSIQFLLPAAYWYAAFFAGRPDHFEAAVLAAVNSGGNNMARAALTGALVGAMVGQSGACLFKTTGVFVLSGAICDGMWKHSSQKALIGAMAGQSGEAGGLQRHCYILAHFTLVPFSLRKGEPEE